MIFKFLPNNKGNKKYENIKDIEERIKQPEFFIKSPSEENIYLSVNFSAPYSSSPSIKVMFSGYDHRSWIHIFISYQELFKDMSSFDIKYLHKTIQWSNGLKGNFIMNNKPNGSDQVPVFIPENPNGHVWKALDMTMTGKTDKIFSMKIDIIMTFKFILWWNVQLKILPGLQHLMSFQGEFPKIKAYFGQKCEINKTCLDLKVYWIPDQLSKYRDDALIEPHFCFQQPWLIESEAVDCLNFSSSSTKQHYYVYIAKPMAGISFSKGVIQNSSFRMSWNYASSLCQDMGGFLPSIRSKSELDEFISLLTFSHDIPPLENVFIGFSIKTKSKV